VGPRQAKSAQWAMAGGRVANSQISLTLRSLGVSIGHDWGIGRAQE